MWNLMIGAALLITGTSIGAGMIGLPVQTAAIGFYPSITVFFIVWILMTFTALCMLEVSLYIDGETNFITMAKVTLGKWGSSIAWVVYIVFLYSLMAAYTAGGSTVFLDYLGLNIDNVYDLIKGALLFVVPFGIIVYLGARCVDYVNRILMIGLAAAYFSLLIFIKDDANLMNQTNAFGDNKFIFFTLPILITSFGFHLLIPTLKTYLKENIKMLRYAIILGAFFPLVIYIFWEHEILSLVSRDGENGLIAMLHSKANPAELIIRAIKSDKSIIKYLIGFFSLFALISSFIAVALGIFDFFADGLKIKKNYSGRLILALLTFVPPAIYTILVPGGFMLALGYAGAFAAILLIIYPALMAWRGRYVINLNKSYQVFGGKFALAIVMLFGLLVIIVEILEQLSFLPIPGK